MRPNKGICKGCGEENWIVNRTHKLCQRCNQMRLHPEGKKPRKEINKISQKQLYIEREYEIAKQEIALEREHVCSGCGTTKYLTHSHLVPRSRRRDLVANKKNIKYHCTTVGDQIGCHQKWEGKAPGRTGMLDYVENLRICLELDPEFAALLLWKDGHLEEAA